MASHIFRSPLPDQEIPEVPLTEYVLQHAESMAGEPAMIDGPSGRTYSFAQLSDHIHRLAGGLTAAGFGAGSTVGIMAPNIPEYAIVFHAVAVAGGTVTTINPTYGVEEVAFQLNDAGAQLLVTIADFVDTAKAAAEGTSVTRIAVIGDSDAEGVTPLAELYGDAIEQVPVDIHEQVVVLPYSSGTTGLPKGVMLTHYNLVANLAQSRPVLDYGDNEMALAVLPFFHIYGMQVLMNGLLAEGVGVVTMPRFDMEQALGLIEKHKVTQFFAVPPIVLGLAKHPAVDNYDLTSLRKIFCGAAPLGAELGEEAAERIGCAVVQGYGMTELSPISHATAGNNAKSGSSGITVPNTECRLVDENGDDQGVGGRGELWVRGPQVMMGYLNNPEATAATIDDDGWLHTGDVAVIDADGHTYIVDRVKELIKYKGFQVPPAELEALVVTHPAVADVAVIGVPDDEAGELPRAYVVLKPGMEATAEDLQAFVAEHVATYKQIRQVVFTDDIPKSASGKILRRFLRDEARAEQA
ncbi:MAG: AMP-binding protein [Acidimicrobiia bacterium]|nr:AMP-binding protein [Acidimicrobiia bacterium]MDH5521208.1 AMP-binding protein [Acidimicrobiia bacterium]